MDRNVLTGHASADPVVKVRVGTGKHKKGQVGKLAKSTVKTADLNPNWAGEIIGPLGAVASDGFVGEFDKFHLSPTKY